MRRAGAGLLRTGRRAALAASLVASWLSGGAAGAAGLSPEEERGRQIYHQGTSPGDSPIFAYVGRENVRMPGQFLVCASCHGEDGLGRPEGGVEPSNVTWSYLTKTYGHAHQNGRRHPAFTEASVAAAIVAQIDPAGNALDPAMPRYEMSAEDLAALLAYMKRLEFQLDPGLSETAIRIGTLLPKSGAYGALGEAVEATIRAYFEEVNAAGGIFGRRLELVVARGAEEPAALTVGARRLVEEDGGVFAVLGAVTLGAERDVWPIFEGAGAPNIDPFTLFAGHGELAGDRTFFLLAGLPGQARALVEYSAKHVAPPPGAVAAILPPATVYDDVARAIEDQARLSGLAGATVLRLAGGRGAIEQVVTEMRGAGIEALYFFGDMTVLGDLIAEAAARNWSPRLFLPGQTAGPAVLGLPDAFDGRIHLAYPNLPEDQSSQGREEFQALRIRHGLAPQYLATQIRALAAAKVLVEGLRRAGRSLSRSALVAALEGLAKFDTGQLPPLSFGSNRRIGARGAHILTVDLRAGRFRPEEVWVNVD